jgi:hypothetical protein
MVSLSQVNVSVDFKKKVLFVPSQISGFLQMSSRKGTMTSPPLHTFCIIIGLRFPETEEPGNDFPFFFPVFMLFD